ncbi:MAG TPA: LTA synthase family protein [Clostridia bacterium]
MKKIFKYLKEDNIYNNYIIMLSCFVLNVGALIAFHLTLGVRMSFFGLITDILFNALIYFLINLIPKAKPKKIVYTIFFSLALLALMADSTYFYKYKSFASLTSLMFVNNIFGQKYGINLPLTCYIIIPMLALGLFIIWYTKLPAIEKKHKSFKANIAMFLAAAFICASINVPTSIYNLTKANTYTDYDLEYIHSKSFLYNNLYSSLKFVETFGYCNFRIRDAASLKVDLEYDDYELLDTYFNSAYTPKLQNDWTLAYKGYNVITILCETFDTRFVDPDYLGAQLVKETNYYLDKTKTLNAHTVGHTIASNLTPNLYKVFDEAITFTNYYVPTFFEGATINTEFMVNNGIYALNAKNFSSNLGDTFYQNTFDLYSLAAQFGKNGYQTFYFHNDSGDFYHRETLTKNQGFKIRRWNEHLVEAGIPTPKVYDTRLLEFFELGDVKAELSKCKADNKPFYMQIDTYSMHLGNSLMFDHHEEEVITSFKKAGIDYKKIHPQIREYYLKIFEFDQFVDKLISKLKELGILDNTLIVFFPDHYNYGLNPNVLEDFIGISAFDKEIHHQKLLVLDGKNYNTSDKDRIYPDKDRIIDTLCCSIDLTPTILNMVLGIENVEYKYYFGKDIFDKGSRIVAFSDITVFDGEMYLNADGSFLYVGDQNLTEEQLKAKFDALCKKQINVIRQFEISKAVLELDYYKYLKDNNKA